jgi:hypothetical protein
VIGVTTTVALARHRRRAPRSRSRRLRSAYVPLAALAMLLLAGLLFAVRG